MSGAPFVPALAAATDAEDFFSALAIQWDPGVLARHRLAVMRRFGLEAAARLADRPHADETIRQEIVRDALAAAYAACAAPQGVAARELWGPAPVRLGLPR